MSLNIMNLCTSMIDTIMIAYFLTKLLDKKINDKKKAILILTGLIIFNTLLNLIFGLASILGFMLIFIVSIVVYSYLLDTRIIKILIGSISAIITMFIIEIIVVNLIIMVFNIDPLLTLEFNIYRILSIIIAKGIFYLTIKYRIGKINIPKDVTTSNMIPFIIIGIFNIVIIFMTFILYKNIDVKPKRAYIYLISMGLGAIIFSWITYKIIKKMIIQSQQEVIWKMRQEEFHKKDFYMQNMNDILNTIRSQKHDLNNYLSTLYGLIYLERFEESKKYITQINDRISNMDDIIETSHPVITALVSMKRNKAYEENIEVILDIELPDDLPFDFVDLSIIIGNLLDNAIEACQGVHKDIKKKIELLIYVKEEYVIIEIVNTKSEAIKVDTKNILRRFTSKNNRENHGYGLGNIENIVKQYNGVMDIYDLGNQFSIEIRLFIGEPNYLVGLTTYAI